jgi:prolipoprotein diacylglyceryltransferase
VPTAVIAFDFDPVARIGDAGVRWETIGIAVAIFAALVVEGAWCAASAMRLDDLLFVALGVVPGAVAGGRLGYVLLHGSFFAEDLRRVVDPAIGSLELTLGVVGGAITGAIVGALLDGRPGRWIQAATVPFLIAVGVGKLAMVLGGSGQGQPTAADPATAYLGHGPWGSLGPDVPSIPSQAIEGVATLLLLAAVVWLLLVPALRRPDGRGFLAVLAAWCVVRFLVAGTWRDEAVLGPLRAEQLIDVAVAAGSLVMLAAVVARARRLDPGTGLEDATRPNARLSA